MTGYKKILVPVDASNKSKNAVNEAMGIAKQYGASLVALYVLPFSPLSYRNVRAAQEVMYSDAKDALEKIKDGAARRDIRVQTKILKGHPGSLISNYANQKKNGIDLVVIGSRDLGGIREMLLGSVSNFVMHKCRVSVLVVK